MDSLTIAKKLKYLVKIEDFQFYCVLSGRSDSSDYFNVGGEIIIPTKTIGSCMLD